MCAVICGSCEMLHGVRCHGVLERVCWGYGKREREREGESRGTCKNVWPGACSCGMLHGVSCHGMLERVRLGIGEREREGENGYV